jgi:hypothetical protein
MKKKLDKRRALSGGIIGFLGYMLSPLSWWNDMFINFPLAYAGAWLVSLFHKSAFGSAFVVFYWITNILGFFMMHKGISRIAGEGPSDQPYLRSGLVKDVLAALAYTVLIILLMKLDIIKTYGA